MSFRRDLASFGELIFLYIGEIFWESAQMDAMLTEK